MDEEYFEWLLRKVGVKDCGESGSYYMLCQVMHDATFYPIIERDANRCADGLKLREEFAEEFGYSFDDVAYLTEMIGGCTVLEMLITLAEAMEYELLESKYEQTAADFFYEFINNLGLEAFDDDYFMSDEYAYYDAEDAIKMFVFRKYNAQGEGGIFPLSSFYREDMRDTELAVQMNRYIAENYSLL